MFTSVIKSANLAQRIAILAATVGLLAATLAIQKDFVTILDQHSSDLVWFMKVWAMAWRFAGAYVPWLVIVWDIIIGFVTLGVSLWVALGIVGTMRKTEELTA